MNDRRTPLALGAVGLIAAVVAAATSGPTAIVLALVAGAAALGAGAAAYVQSNTAEDEHLRSLERQSAAAAITEQRLGEATERVAELERTIADHEARAAEQSSEPPTDSSDPASLTDPESHLFSEAYFHVALDARIASARRHLRPVAVALLQVYEGVAGPGAAAAPPERSAEAIRQTVRDADTACRLADGVYAVILEDTPENGAVWTVERVRRNLVSRFGSHTMWAGVACYPAHAFSADELLAQARSALDSAREWKQDRIEVAISE